MTQGGNNRCTTTPQTQLSGSRGVQEVTVLVGQKKRLPPLFI